MSGIRPEPLMRDGWGRLDAFSRLQLRIFALHLAIIMAFGLPASLVDPAWSGILVRLAMALRMSALGLLILALICRLRWTGRSLCLWDEVAALFALSLLCTALARHMV